MSERHIDTKDLKVKADNHVAEGEVTGHFHEVVGRDATVYEYNQDGFEHVVDAPNGGGVVHQEHSRVDLPAGQFGQRRVQEFDHLAEEARAVRD